ncbi:MAG: hypothetical protein ABJA78_17290 [Ferruginibacter sp.]
MQKLFFLSGLFLLTAYGSTAQPFTMNPDIVPTELNLYPYKPADKKMEGRMNATDVTQQKDTLYFFAKGFSIYSAAYVGITCEDKSNDLEIGLFTENWLQPVKHGNTADSGHWEQRFKTEGDFGIRVIAKTKPAKYSIVVWNGKDVEINVPSPFNYQQGGGDGSPGFFKKNWVYILIAVLLIAVIILLLKRKKN